MKVLFCQRKWDNSMKVLILFSLILTACSKDGKPSIAASIPGLNNTPVVQSINVLVGGQSNATLYLGGAGMPTYFRDALKEWGIEVNLALTAVSGSSQAQWATGGTLYNNLINQGKAMGNVDVLLWWQGEAEGATMTAPLGQPQPIYLAQAWNYNFTQFVKEVRKNLGNPDLLVIFCQIGPNPGSLDSWDEVRHQQSMVYLSNTYMVKTDDIANFHGWFHTDENGYKAIGQRIAAKWLEHR